MPESPLEKALRHKQELEEYKVEMLWRLDRVRDVLGHDIVAGVRSRIHEYIPELQELIMDRAEKQILGQEDDDLESTAKELKHWLRQTLAILRSMTTRKEPEVKKRP